MKRSSPNRNPARAILCVFVTAATLCASPPAQAGEADVIAAKARRSADGAWSFAVTIRSVDRGRKYYCDRFEVRAPDGRVLGVRELMHPHEDEQPFTRDLGGVAVPPGLAGVLIRAHHSARGYDGHALKLRLPGAR